MKKDQSAKEELQGISPFLARLRSTKHEDDLPVEFFEQLPEDVFRRIKLEDQHAAAERSSEKPGWLSWLFPAQQPRLALAFATVLLLAVVAVFSFWPESQQTSDLAVAGELSVEDWETYVTEHIDEFDSELLWQATETSPEALDAPTEEPDALLDELLEELNEDDLKEFFM